MNHFDKRDEIFAEFALDKVKRQKHIQILSKTRQRLLVPLQISLFVSIALVVTDLFNKTVTLFPFLLLAGAIVQLILAVQIDLDIRLLKLIDMMQQAKDATAQS